MREHLAIFLAALLPFIPACSGLDAPPDAPPGAGVGIAGMAGATGGGAGMAGMAGVGAGGSGGGAGIGGAVGVAGAAGIAGTSMAGTGGRAPASDCGFLYGINYAWHHFGADFGGIAAWGQRGVSANQGLFRGELKDMRDHGARVVRWWMFEEFRGEGILFDASDNPIGLGAATVLDIQAALELADEVDIDLMFTLFSFDNFRPTRDEFGIHIPGLAPLVVDDTRRRKLMEAVVRPVARAVAASPFAHRMTSWDVINEPEWAIQGQGLYVGDPAFDPMMGLEHVSHAQMERFISDVIAVLRQETTGVPVSVGGTATKWANAWTMVDTDFHQAHIYDWVNKDYPYHKTPTEYGLDDKPLVMGEFWIGGLTGVTYEQLVTTWRRLGYAGALSWSYTDSSLSAQQLSQGLDDMLRIARIIGCDGGGATGGTPCVSGMTEGWDFACGVEGFEVTHSEPSDLGSFSQLDWDANDGDPAPGSLVASVPFDAPMQKATVALLTDKMPLDLNGRILTARVRLDAGPRPSGRASVKLYVKTAPSWNWTDGGMVSLSADGGWSSLSLALSAAQGIDPGKVWEVGVELSTGLAGPFVPIEVHVDTFGY